MKKGYVIQPSYLIARVGDNNEIYKKMELVQKAWEVTNERADLCGNIRAYYSEKGAVYLTQEYGQKEKEHYNTHQFISSALALYRAISLFQCGVDDKKTQDFYKMNWSITLKHKATGDFLMLGEWKGGFQIFSASPYEVMPKAKWKKDTIALLEVLGAKKMPIGYDGVVAGSVA